MKVPTAVLIAVLFCSCMFFHEAWAQSPGVSGSKSQDSDAVRYWESVEKRRKINRCVKLGRGECYKKYQDAVDWCLKNWNKCLPMIKHVGVYAGAYGDQVAEQCKRVLEEKCRREAGP